MQIMLQSIFLVCNKESGGYKEDIKRIQVEHKENIRKIQDLFFERIYQLPYNG